MAPLTVTCWGPLSVPWLPDGLARPTAHPTATGVSERARGLPRALWGGPLTVTLLGPCRTAGQAARESFAAPGQRKSLALDPALPTFAFRIGPPTVTCGAPAFCAAESRLWTDCGARACFASQG